ncbi:LITAF domain-containing protein-like isoform X2 [Paramacrobiotus metropolitanus]|uniref:LITAF domain-containing protein-like isoform X2 n=1 Tax=Paramacrobiotus metropolitanus TaxID=2943436 RepID=UPI00244574E4|nr:LITAF domain-containing protein-like isoform X2 [Paramacrobiotus metropolitanus]
MGNPVGDYPAAPGQQMPPPPPAYPYPPPNSYQHGAPVSTVIITSPGVCLSQYPTQLECPNCRQHVVTTTEFENGGLTYALMGLLCLFGCWLGCCLIPTCVDECKDVLHTCPNCKVFVGRYKRI